MNSGSDLVSFVLHEVVELLRRRPGASEEEVRREILPIVHAQYGGESHWLPKRSPELVRQSRDALMRDVLGSASDRELIERHGVSRSTLYRLIKKADR